MARYYATKTSQSVTSDNAKIFLNLVLTSHTANCSIKCVYEQFLHINRFIGIINR